MFPSADTPRHAPPRSRLTPRVRRDVAVDRTAYRLLASRAKRPDPGDLERIAAEVDAAHTLFEGKGWLADPASYHRDPPTPRGVRTSRQRSGNVRYTALTWLDEYECWPDEPGADRFVDYRRNRVARAALLEHRGGDRPWVVCVHGFGMGNPTADLRGFRALHLHRDLGLNVALLTLPFHGRRRTERFAFPQVPGADVLDNVHGMTQAAWDARQLLALVRDRSERPVAMMGMSLGGCVTALTASLTDLDGAVLLIPVADLGAVMADAAGRFDPPPGHEELLERARELMDVVCPLAMSPRVPRYGRFLVGGTLDQFVRASARPRRSPAIGTSPTCTGTTAGTSRCSGPGESRRPSTTRSVRG